ncbi:hypothetical protein DYB32_007486, partial [Aphanomyces invadans]
MSSSTGRRVAALQNGESFADSTISTAHSDDVGHDFHTAPSNQIKVSTTDFNHCLTLGSQPGEDYCVVWTRNEEVSGCMVCNTKFTLFLRRHHCRVRRKDWMDTIPAIGNVLIREVYGLVGMHRVCDACLTNGVWMDPVARRRLERLEQSHSIAHEDDDDDGVYFTGQSIDGRNDCRRKTVPGATSTEGTVEWAQAPGKGHNNTVQPEDEHANNADDDACLTESVLGNDSTKSQDERSLSASNVNKAKTVKDHGPEEDEVLEVDDSSMHKHTEIGDNDVGAPVPAVELVQNEVVVTCSVDLPVDGKSSGLETLLSDPPDFPDEFVDERPRTLTWVNANLQHFTDKSVPIKALSTPLREALSRQAAPRLTW